ncbi:carbon dioxide-concentrating protein CcmK, partial [Geitlerinema sp. P-1104]|nr:carbon dioxide-concentrating protein CcmK [Geitlerinema sp. P-1104]NMG60593.1 carbon dioxide-concentrating protein CcmK [Geitlerinema sp. P-1104]
ATLESWVIIPRPHENIVAVLPIDYGPDVEEFRDAVNGGRLPRSLSSGS